MRPNSPLRSFPGWLSKQGRGALTRLQLATGLSYSLLQKARRGEPVSLECAALLSEQTGIPVGQLCPDAPAWLKDAKP